MMTIMFVMITSFVSHYDCGDDVEDDDDDDDDDQPRS